MGTLHGAVGEEIQLDIVEAQVQHIFDLGPCVLLPQRMGHIQGTAPVRGGHGSALAVLQDQTLQGDQGPGDGQQLQGLLTLLILQTRQ